MDWQKLLNSMSQPTAEDKASEGFKDLGKKALDDGKIPEMGSSEYSSGKVDHSFDLMDVLPADQLALKGAALAKLAGGSAMMPFFQGGIRNVGKGIKFIPGSKQSAVHELKDYYQSGGVKLPSGADGLPQSIKDIKSGASPDAIRDQMRALEAEGIPYYDDRMKTLQNSYNRLMDSPRFNNVRKMVK